MTFFIILILAVLAIVLIGIFNERQLAKAKKTEDKKKRQELEEREEEIKRKVGIWKNANGQQKELLSKYHSELVSLTYKAISATFSTGFYLKSEHSTLKGVAAGALGGPLYGHVVRKESQQRNAEVATRNRQIFEQNYKAKSESAYYKGQITVTENKIKAIEDEIISNKDITLSDWCYENYKTFDWGNLGYSENSTIIIDGVEYRYVYATSSNGNITIEKKETVA